MHAVHSDDAMQRPAPMIKSQSDRHLHSTKNKEGETKATAQPMLPGDISARRNIPTRTQSARFAMANETFDKPPAVNMGRVMSVGRLPTRSNSCRRIEKDIIDCTNATFVEPGVINTRQQPDCDGASQQSKRRDIRRTQSARSNLVIETSVPAIPRAPSTGSIPARRNGVPRSNSERAANAVFPEHGSDKSRNQIFDLNSSSLSLRSRKNTSHTKSKTRDNTPQDPSWTPLYQYARQGNWKAVSQQCKLLPRDAKCVDPSDGTTALHLAVISRTNPTLRKIYHHDTPPAPLELIEELAASCPEAGIIRCHLKTYTPLCYACSVYEREYSMQNAKIMIRILLEHAPQSAYVFTDDGLSALDIQILSSSRLFKNEPTIDSTIALTTLLDGHPRLAKTRCFKNEVRGPIEILYRSNRARFKKIAEQKTSPDSWWAWKWVIILLRNSSITSRFNILHAAAGLTGCPVAILKIAAQNNLEQLSQVVDESGNMPLHEVCMWIDEQNEEQMTGFINQRKREAIQCLLRLNSKIARIKNFYGETPLQLAIESQTPYPRGIQALKRAYPGALCLPRSLRAVKDENEKLLSVDLYDDNESIDSDWENPVLAVEGMYPFMVAAVVAVEPASWKSREVLLETNAPDQTARWNKQHLASLETIYSLLRANPSMLGLYKPVYRELDYYSESEYSSEEYTDEYVEESEGDYTEVTQED